MVGLEEVEGEGGGGEDAEGAGAAGLFGVGVAVAGEDAGDVVKGGVEGVAVGGVEQAGEAGGAVGGVLGGGDVDTAPGFRAFPGCRGGVGVGLGDQGVAVGFQPGGGQPFGDRGQGGVDPGGLVGAEVVGVRGEASSDPDREAGVADQLPQLGESVGQVEELDQLEPDRGFAASERGGEFEGEVGVHIGGAGGGVAGAVIAPAGVVAQREPEPGLRFGSLQRQSGLPGVLDHGQGLIH